MAEEHHQGKRTRWANAAENVYASDVSTFTTTSLAVGTYYLIVEEGTLACGACADGGFTLTVSES